MSTPWTGLDDLRQQVQKWWQKGELLASVVKLSSVPDDADGFPRKLALKVPTASELGTRFDEVRNWIAALKSVPHCRLEWREFKHRQLGSNSMPEAVWIDTLDDACALIGMRRALAQFRALLESTRQQQPLLLPWLARRPLRALELAPDWPRLLAIVSWLQQHPRPAVYLRQVDVPGVHSKFIESQRAVLAELFELALPVEAIRQEAGLGVSQFAARYGFLDKPQLVRLRLLDPACTAQQPLQTAGPTLPADVIAPSQPCGEGSAMPGSTPGSINFSYPPWGNDITLAASDFARLNLPCRTVFITENEVNFLAFPPVAGAVVVFGAGYGFEALREAAWLQQRRVVYWGDIDTHGFAILDQLRASLPQVESMLMDHATLLAHQMLWGEEDSPLQRDLPRLTAAERALYDDLRDQRLGRNVRLEQERVGFAYVLQALAGERA